MLYLLWFYQLQVYSNKLSNKHTEMSGLQEQQRLSWYYSTLIQDITHQKKKKIRQSCWFLKYSGTDSSGVLNTKRMRQVDRYLEKKRNKIGEK